MGNNQLIGHEGNNLGKDGKYKCESFSYVGYCEHYDSPRCKLICNYALEEKQKEREHNRLRNNPCFGLVLKVISS